MEVRGQPLKAGRSKASYMLVAGKHLHAFVWWHKLGTDSAGFTVRLRRKEQWYHLRVILFQRNRKPYSYARDHAYRGGQRFLIRRTLTILELSTWQTEHGWSQRSNLKSYIRLKAAAGGRRINEET